MDENLTILNGENRTIFEVGNLTIFSHGGEFVYFFLKGRECTLFLEMGENLSIFSHGEFDYYFAAGRTRQFLMGRI